MMKVVEKIAQLKIMPTQFIVCVDCNTEFTFGENEQKFFESKNYTPPKRCKLCRFKRRNEKEKTQNDGGNFHDRRDKEGDDEY